MHDVQHREWWGGAVAMLTVWKFVLPSAFCTVQMPVGAQVLRIAKQRCDICMWALVQPGNALERRHFAAVFTGEPIPAGQKYVGTFDSDDLVYHVFEPLVQP